MNTIFHFVMTDFQVYYDCKRLICTFKYFYNIRILSVAFMITPPISIQHVDPKFE